MLLKYRKELPTIKLFVVMSDEHPELSRMLLKYRKELPTIKLLTEKQVSKSLSFCQ